MDHCPSPSAICAASWVSRRPLSSLLTLHSMLADAVISLAYVAGRSLLPYTSPTLSRCLGALFRKAPQGYASLSVDDSGPTSPLSDLAPEASSSTHEDRDAEPEEDEDAPPEYQISNKVVLIGLVLSILFCVGSIHVVFNRHEVIIPLYATIAAVGIALLLSISMSNLET